MKCHSRILASLVLLSLAALAVSGCLQQQSIAAAAPEEPAPEEAKAEFEHQVARVTATGRVVPAEWTVLSFPTGGTVLELNVDVGDSVEAGDVIARLGTADLEMQRLEAEANLARAQANLAKVSAGPSEEEIRAAEQAVAAANARAAAAAARRDALYTQTDPGEIAEAESRLLEAQLRRARALEDLQWLQNFNPEDCERYERQQDWTFAGLTILEEIYNELKNDPDFDIDLPDDIDFSLPPPPRQACPLGSYKQVEDYYHLTELEVQAAQLYLDELKAGPDPNLVRVENARIWMASAQAQAAQARLDYLLAQPFPEQVAVAEAQLEQAERELELVMLQFKQTELVAPFSGVITERYLDANEFTTPGQPIVQIAALDRLRVETTDLSEIDVARLELGDTALVGFDALGDVQVSGRVVGIAPKAEEGMGVNFTVLIELDEVPENLRWGMTAFVEIEDE